MPVTDSSSAGIRTMSPQAFETKSLPADFDVTAPDGSGIRILPRLKHGSMAHGTLAPGSTSHAVRHKSVEEIWFVLSGEAEIWRANDDIESIERVGPGDALTIPVSTGFQMRTVGNQPFQFIMCTMPPWPDHDEAVRIRGRWPVDPNPATQP
jgi:mannose-6-phosphate isomerase-like protein (cupin superfamily)